MQLNFEMNREATDYAKELARKGFLMHSNSRDGENLYMRCGWGSLSAKAVVEAW